VPKASQQASVTRARNRREQVLEILYEADIKDVLPSTVAVQRAYTLDPFVKKRIKGIEGQQKHLADLISRFAIGWNFDRLSPIDRCILLFGTFEIVFLTEVPGAVAINEAVSLANKFSSSESVNFVNGILGAILAEVQSTPRP